jgi:hypothetical protein
MRYRQGRVFDANGRSRGKRRRGDQETEEETLGEG